MAATATPGLGAATLATAASFDARAAFSEIGRPWGAVPVDTVEILWRKRRRWEDERNEAFAVLVDMQVLVEAVATGGVAAGTPGRDIQVDRRNRDSRGEPRCGMTEQSCRSSPVTTRLVAGRRSAVTGAESRCGNPRKGAFECPTCLLL